jgi:hypothetical protein
MAPARSWLSVIERFADFQAKPCLRASGPQLDRPEREEVLRKLKRQFAAIEQCLPPSPDKVTQEHIAEILARRGLGTRGAGKRPEHRSFWHGIFRAIVFDRDDYRCFFCGRSAEEGIDLPEHGILALRLELDHASPRAGGGEDYVLTNVRTTCRTCNISRGRMTETQFRAELRSLARSVLR